MLPWDSYESVPPLMLSAAPVEPTMAPALTVRLPVRPCRSMPWVVEADEDSVSMTTLLRLPPPSMSIALPTPVMPTFDRISVPMVVVVVPSSRADAELMAVLMSTPRTVLPTARSMP
jgi:hypothetical protein